MNVQEPGDQRNTARRPGEDPGAKVDAGARLLLCRAGASLCGLPVQQVVETMRPLPIEPLRGAPAGVLGVARVRGAATPVLDMATLLSGAPAELGRFVTVRAGRRVVALAVGGVAGVRELSSETLEALPPLLREAGEAVVAIGALDAALILVLESARLVPEDLWPAIEGGGATA